MLATLAHVALEVTDLDASIAHACEVLGMREVDRQDGRVYLTLGSPHNTYGGPHHVLEYKAGPVTALAQVGWRVQNAAALSGVRDALAAAGVAVRPGEPRPGVAESICFATPGGHQLEVCCGADYSQPAHTASGVSLRRIQHVNLNASDLPSMLRFMTDALGLRVSDYATRGGELTLAFLRCSTDHHTVGLAAGPDGLFHVAFETASMADLACLGDALARHGRRLLWGPGRHGAGDNVATYHTDPSGVPIEVFWDMQRIDDEAWQPRTWTLEDHRLVNQWGPVGDVPALLAISIPNAGVKARAAA